MRAVLGFAPHSGWAATVIVVGNAREPRVVYRGRVELADTALAGAKQPYHWVESHALREAKRELAQFEKQARRMAEEGVRLLVAEAVRQGYEVKQAGILASSGRQGSSLEAILKSHALIHKADGDHFRDALEEGCRSAAVEVVRVPRGELDSLAAKTLRMTKEAIDAKVRDAGRSVGSPWAKDQKSSFLLGWYLLSRDGKA